MYTVIGIDPPPGVPIKLVLKDVIDALYEGYGAGTIMVPGYNHVFASWTSVPQHVTPENGYKIIITSPVPISRFAMIDLVSNYEA